jgi:RNB domain
MAVFWMMQQLEQQQHCGMTSVTAFPWISTKSSLQQQQQPRYRRLYSTEEISEGYHIADAVVASSSSTNHHRSNNCLERLLRQNEPFGQRLMTIPITNNNNSQRYPIAEIYIHGQCVLVKIISVIVPQHHPSQSSSLLSEPKLQVERLSSSSSSSSWTSQLPQPHVPVDGAVLPMSMVIDIGQLTTVWDGHLHDDDDDVMASSIVNAKTTEVQFMDNTDVELELDRLHHIRCNCPKTSSKNHRNNNLQQQINQVLQENCATEQEREYTTLVLRKIQKTGVGYTRLVDSNIAAPYLFPNHDDTIQHRAMTAHILARDAETGGRFKRWPCLYVPSIHNDDDTDDNILIVNGGWLVTDPSIRTGLEARKFAERTLTNGKKLSNSTDGSIRPVADDRIFRRLECLAMGELINAIPINKDTTEGNHHRTTAPKLELDVREVLRAMELPINPDGAKQALVRTGYWSADTSKHESFVRIIQPWSQPVLEAAKWYATTVSACDSSSSYGSSRIDLTQFPCVSVDAAKATFRDDAIGVRPRAGTGRKVIPNASKWEILVHIADVSDIYTIPTVQPSESMSTESQTAVSILRSAAERRGSSRYDLPLGPLHLLPPVVLHALAFPPDRHATCRCVTVWAYIDERNGSLLDCGVERTWISSPINLSFGDATKLLQRNGSTASTSDDPARALLMVAERNLKLWAENHRRQNVAALQREKRLTARELTTQSLYRNSAVGRDDGVDGFRRSRGHRVVDASLMLYSIVANDIFRRMKAPFPRAIGADASRGGRVGTAPLRRYIDGQTQRQLLAVACNYGQRMTMTECKEVSNIANKANNSIKNIRSIQRK